MTAIKPIDGIVDDMNDSIDDYNDSIRRSFSPVEKMRLIDADKLCTHLADLQLSNAPDERDSEDVQKEMELICEFIEILIKLIEKQPTAYDVDKVVDRLDDYLFQKYCVEGDSKIYGIVKAGGE